jgi:hypothetical protein
MKDGENFNHETHEGHEKEFAKKSTKDAKIFYTNFTNLRQFAHHNPRQRTSPLGASNLWQAWEAHSRQSCSLFQKRSG